MLTLFHSGHSDLGCYHSPEAWAGLFPKDGLWWGWQSWEGFASQWAPPRGPGKPTPLCPGQQPPDPGGFSCSETTHAAPKGCGASGLKELWKARWVQVSWRWGSSRLPLGRPPCGWKHPPQSGVAGTGIWPGNRSKGGRRNGTQALSANCQSRNRTFPKAVVPPVNKVGPKDMLPPCGHFPKQQLWNCCSWALNIPKACRAVSEKHQPSRNVLGEVIRKIFKTGKMFWIFIQEANLNK